MQGWEALDPDVSLDSNSKLQGTYSIKLSKWLGNYGTGNWNMIRIKNINISNSIRPLLVFTILVESGTNGCCPNPVEFIVTLYDEIMNQIGSHTFRILNDRNSVSTNRCIALVLDPYKSSLNAIMFSVYIRNPCASTISYNVFVDMISIMEADANYNVSLVLQNGEAREIIKTLGISITNSRYAYVDLAFPPWFVQEETTSDQLIVESRFQRTDGQLVTLSIDSSSDNYKHLNGANISQLINIVDRIRFYLKVTTISVNYAKYTRYVAVILMSNGYTSYNYVILFKIQYTVNPHTPITQSGSVIITPGQSVTKSFEMISELRFNSGGIRLRVINITNNYTDVLGGSINMSIYNYYTSELVGSASVDPKTGNNLLSDLVEISPDTRYRIIITFNNISVRSNVSFKGYIVYEVS